MSDWMVEQDGGAVAPVDDVPTVDASSPVPRALIRVRNSPVPKWAVKTADAVRVIESDERPVGGWPLNDAARGVEAEQFVPADEAPAQPDWIKLPETW